MKLIKNTFQAAFLLGIALFGSFAHSQTVNSGKWVRVADLASVVPGNISYGSCEYRLTANQNYYLPNGALKSQGWIKLSLDGAQYYNFAPQAKGAGYSYSFEAPSHKISSIVIAASSLNKAEQDRYIDDVRKSHQSSPNLHCVVNFTFIDIKKSEASVACDGNLLGSEAEFSIRHPLNKAKLILEKQCN